MTIESTTITLGERDFVVSAAPFIRSSPWRKRLVAEVKPLFDMAATAPDMTFERPEDLLQLWPLLNAILVDGIDTVFELLIAYSPVLEDERGYIENNATEKQILAGFQEVVRLSDPFGLAQLLGRRTGLARSGTGQRSPSPNGATVEPQPTPSPSQS